MRCVERNKQTFYYALYEGTEDIVDEEGYITGTKVVYSEPIKAKANINPAKGKTTLDLFGIDSSSYQRVILMEKTDIKEDSVLWIGIEPTDNYNYIVKKVAKGLNSVAIAIARVE